MFRGIGENSANPPLHFGTATAAFDYLCEFSEVIIQIGRPVPALVLDARKEFGTKKSIHIDDAGIQKVLLKIPSKDGGFRVLAETASANGPNLKVGELVSWVPGEFSEIEDKGGDRRAGWVGLVTGILKPVLKEDHWIKGETFS